MFSVPMFSSGAMNAIHIHVPAAGNGALPLLVDSPHSGRHYPADFMTACTREQLRGNEDFHVDELLSLIPPVGATVLNAHYPRTYIDVNRALTDLDPSLLFEPWPWLTKPSAYTQSGIGLIHREVRPGVPIYRERLSVGMVQTRIRTAYLPYHEALAQLRTQLLARFGVLMMLNVHSMPNSSAPKDERGQRYDVVLGDRDGQSSLPVYTHYLAQMLTQAGLRVGVNKIYKGGEIIRRHGAPADNVHAVQIEFNRTLYMDELSQTLSETGVRKLQKVLRDIAPRIANAIQREEAMAAE